MDEYEQDSDAFEEDPPAGGAAARRLGAVISVRSTPTTPIDCERRASSSVCRTRRWSAASSGAARAAEGGTAAPRHHGHDPTHLHAYRRGDGAAQGELKKLEADAPKRCADQAAYGNGPQKQANPLLREGSVRRTAPYSNLADQRERIQGIATAWNRSQGRTGPFPPLRGQPGPSSERIGNAGRTPMAAPSPCGGPGSPGPLVMPMRSRARASESTRSSNT